MMFDSNALFFFFELCYDVFSREFQGGTDAKTVH